MLLQPMLNSFAEGMMQVRGRHPSDRTIGHMLLAVSCILKSQTVLVE
jgi:hypothetical protein